MASAKKLKLHCMRVNWLPSVFFPEAHPLCGRGGSQEARIEEIFNMVWTHPHVRGKGTEWWVKTVHVEGAGAKVAAYERT